VIWVEFGKESKKKKRINPKDNPSKKGKEAALHEGKHLMSEGEGGLGKPSSEREGKNLRER